jgi:hypothetical protein
MTPDRWFRARERVCVCVGVGVVGVAGGICVDSRTRSVYCWWLCVLLVVVKCLLQCRSGRVVSTTVLGRVVVQRPRTESIRRAICRNGRERSQSCVVRLQGRIGVQNARLEDQVLIEHRKGVKVREGHLSSAWRAERIPEIDRAT